jgi:hypothetical protein
VWPYGVAVVWSRRIVWASYLAVVLQMFGQLGVDAIALRDHEDGSNQLVAGPFGSGRAYHAHTLGHPHLARRAPSKVLAASSDAAWPPQLL